MKNRTSGVLPRILAVIGSLAMAAALGPAANAAPSGPVVKTPQGAVRGIVKENVRQFLGIPYAAPPVGKLRWRAPEPHPKWAGTLDATLAGNECAQIDFRTRRVAGAEDCLYLNIYTPNPPGADLPVMVWIHGGTFLIGSGADYDGSHLAAKGHMVVVTINYRLGPLGFLAEPSLDAENPRHVSGNYGLLDQQAALRWVKDNISAFGGDAAKVTVAGESAGAISVGLQLVSPGANGLFERAIMESGPFLLHQPTLKHAEVRGDEFAEKLDCDKAADAAACMRSKGVGEILNAIPASPIGPLVWAPVVDDDVIPGQPAAVFASGNFNKVAVVNGSNHDEGTLFLAFARSVSEKEYEARVRKRFGKNADKVLAAYPLSHYVSSAQAAAVQLGDVFSCSVLKANDALSKSVPVYAYEFNDEHPPAPPWLPPSPFPLGAYHSSEIQYVFGGAKDLTPEQQKLSNEMMGYWIGFITSGDPGTHSPRWVGFTAKDDKILSLAPGAIGYESDFAKAHQCALWSSIGPAF